ncbi:hypothetical protein DCAR_0207080 [Daucus carota subsp. sativus]|uniref:PGG domain-containing protein n=1 Tax=Daucus carota subsp. sativus TaxID=79200 RepID=A0AAF0WGQ3_DAUCS|nr:PREDICTED: uncharacterized protein LOC108208335 isoform X2 [Daucus carota subsp. sativus]WOG87848.1 hypothetical protein DCAR_0207080 [Daucus carota subsp. sativus]
MDTTNTTVNPVNLAGYTESAAPLLQIYYRCERRMSDNDELPEGSAERKQFAVSVCGNYKNLFIKLGDFGSTAFHLAVRNDSTEMLEALIEAARRLPPPSSTNDDPQTTTLETILRRGDRWGTTALHAAVMVDKFEHARLLAEADPNYRHMQGELSHLCTAASLGYLNIVKMIAETCTAPAVDGALIAVIPHLPEGYSVSSDIVESIIEQAEDIIIQPIQQITAF